MVTVEHHIERRKWTMSAVLWWCCVLLCVLNVCEGYSVPGSKTCGERQCNDLYYCDPLHLQCSACSNICQKNDNNYDLELCEGHCQDYLRKESCASAQTQDVSSESLQGQVNSLRGYVVVSVVANILLLCALVASITLGMMRRRKGCFSIEMGAAKLAAAVGAGKNEKDKSTSPKTESTTASTAELSSVESSPRSDDAPLGPVSTSTPLSSKTRCPSEDATLDYAYDNPALAITPSPSIGNQDGTLMPRLESSF